MSRTQRSMSSAIQAMLCRFVCDCADHDALQNRDRTNLGAATSKRRAVPDQRCTTTRQSDPRSLRERVRRVALHRIRDTQPRYLGAHGTSLAMRFNLILKMGLPARRTLSAPCGRGQRDMKRSSPCLMAAGQRMTGLPPTSWNTGGCSEVIWPSAPNLTCP